jgi:hypothetical protein
MNTMLDVPDRLRPEFTRQLYRRSLVSFYLRADAILHPGRKFIMAPYVDAICHAVEKVFSGETPQLIINVPPRHGKSEMVSVAAVAWMLGIDPSLKIMNISYGYDLLNKVSKLTRAIIGHPDYQKIFPGTRIAKGQDTSALFVTTQGGERRSVSESGPATGHGANIHIIDDLHKADEALTERGRGRLSPSSKTHCRHVLKIH